MFRKMKDSGVEWIGEIPEEWRKAKLKNIYDVKKAKLPTAFYEDDSLIPYMSMEYIRGISTTPRYAKDGEYCKKDDVLILWDGSNAGEIILNHPEGYAPSTTAILSLKGKINENFIKYYLKFLETQLRKNRTGMGIPHINGEFLRNSTILIPTKTEQEKIAVFLDEKISEIDKIIEKTKESIEEYKKYKQAIIAETVTKGLNINVEMKDSGIEWIGEIPKDWEIIKLRYLGNCQNGISKNAGAFGSGYPFVSYKDVYKNYVLPKTVNGLIETNQIEQNKYSVIYGDVFFTRTSETIEEVGFAATCLETIKNAVFAGFVIRFRPFNKNKLNPNFSKYYFRSDIHRKFFAKEMNLVTRASLSQELLKSLPVLLPPLLEQQQIADFLDNKCTKIDDLITKKEKFIKELEVYKKSLIYEYVTGKRGII